MSRKGQNAVAIHGNRWKNTWKVMEDDGYRWYEMVVDGKF
jgi:hypothetical protein